MGNLPETMKAVVTHGEHDYRFENVSVPRAGKDGLLLKVEACGICSGDIKAYKGGEVFWGGAKPYLETPAIGGHEFIGTVIEAGEQFPNRNIALGDRVAVEQILPCGECTYCKKDMYWLCKKHDVYGFKHYLNGGFAEFALLPRNSRVYKIPKEMPMEKAVLIEPFGCAMHAIDRSKITSDDIVVIAGAGPLGLAMITIAKNLKPKKLISLDLNDGRLYQAMKFGCDLCINPLKENAVEIINSLTEGCGCDVYIEATGHPSSVTQGLSIIRKQGRFVEFSLFNDSVTCNWSVVGDGKELDIYGVSLSPFTFQRVIDGMCDSSIKTDGIVTHQFKLEDFQHALDVSSSGEAIKVVFILE